MKRFVLIDGHSLLFRAYHALPKTFTDREGRPINAIYGFMSMLIRVVKDLKPDFLIVAFDEKGPTFRHADLVTYKEGRPEMDEELTRQQPVVREMLAAFSIPVLSVEGYEGEDVIATIIQNFKFQISNVKSEEMEFYVVSGDRDVLQLVGRNVKVYSPKKGLSDPVVYDEDNVQTVFGVKASEISDYKGLRGDPSDRIPGVFGIGEKTAVSLVGEFGTIENLYRQIGQVRKKFGGKIEKKILEGAEQAILSKKLATIAVNAPVSIEILACKLPDLKTNKTGLKFLADLNFRSLIKRLTGEERIEPRLKKRKKEPVRGGRDQISLL